LNVKKRKIESQLFRDTDEYKRLVELEQLRSPIRSAGFFHTGNLSSMKTLKGWTDPIPLLITKSLKKHWLRMLSGK